MEVKSENPCSQAMGYVSFRQKQRLRNALSALSAYLDQPIQALLAVVSRQGQVTYFDDFLNE